MNEGDLEAIQICDAHHEVHRVAAEPPDQAMNDTDRIPSWRKIELLIKSAFEPLKWYPQRFTQDDGDAAFYAALELKTACDEVAHHVLERFGNLLTVRNGAPVRFLHFLCVFKGKLKDICALAERYPDLLGDGHNDACVFVARHARQAGADGLLSPSARNRPDGRCMTVFKRETLSPLRIEHAVLFAVNPGTDRVEYRFQPYVEQPYEW
ncbi:hypothetical protein DF3PB_2690003 [uncultured Defluviicoccus sp.]|uniref:RES domain-containing protein n=1 Tax=metagenome TaxID=256318 RepID=A0A380TCY0_9ZZZZ|nr:hypothetical protein DF3PB_2690003 [uncultured Defluviicoccus sp.]